jgi:6-O-methylguanine DNA methyltransferase, DNA binding domain
VMTEDAIVDIPENRFQYFGGPGKMLLPCPATIATVIEKIPAHQLITTETIQNQLAEQFDVDGTCPITTQRSLQALANDPQTHVAYWRVVNKNGGLIARFPGGAAGHAAHLEDEGFSIDTQAKPPKVKQFRESLVQQA